MDKPIRKPIQLSEELHAKVSGYAKANNMSMIDVIDIAFKKLTEVVNVPKPITKPLINNSNIYLFSYLKAIKDGEILDVQIIVNENYNVTAYNQDYAILSDKNGDQIMINFKKINDWFEIGNLNDFELLDEGPLYYESIKEYKYLIANKSGVLNGTKIIKGFEYPIIKHNTTYVFFEMPNYDENFIKYDIINQWFTGK